MSVNALRAAGGTFSAVPVPCMSPSTSTTLKPCGAGMFARSLRVIRPRCAPCAGVTVSLCAAALIGQSRAAVPTIHAVFAKVRHRKLAFRSRS